jgi:hypothetical protein
VHQSSSFQDLASWIPAEARGNIRVSLESRDGDDFHSFCQSVVKDAGEPYGETFLGCDKVVGRSITVRFFTRAPGPPGLRNPEWLLLMRAVKLTLVGVQLAVDSPVFWRGLPLLGQAQVPEVTGVFTADLSGGTPQQWTLQVAHVRYLLDLDVASGTYDMDTGNVKPFELIANLYNFEFAKEEGVGASVFSRAAANLEYAATSALNIAQRSASWLTRKALGFKSQLSLRLTDDDTVPMSFLTVMTAFGGLRTSVKIDIMCGKVGFSYGGLDALFFVADPEQPLDGTLRATWIRISSTRTAGEFNVHRPYVSFCTWGNGNFRVLCKTLSLDSTGTSPPVLARLTGQTLTPSPESVSEVEDVSELLEKLEVSPGAGLLNDGCASICIGQSDA